MKRILSSILIVLAAAQVLLLGGCVGARRVDPAAIDAARGYAQALVPAFNAVTLTDLREYATPDQVDRVRLYVVMLTEERRLIPSATLFSQEVESAEVQDDGTVHVRASERWSITYTNRDTGNIVETEDYTASVEYRVMQHEGSWYVYEVITE